MTELQINTEKLKQKIVVLHKNIEDGISTRANYPDDCDADWWNWFSIQNASFQVLAEIAQIPVDPSLYWRAVSHFSECYNLESSDLKNSEQQALIDKVSIWLKGFN